MKCFFAKLKLQPLRGYPSISPLNGWKAFGYKEGQDVANTVSLKKRRLAIVSARKTIRIKIDNDGWIQLNMKGDFIPKWFNLFVDGKHNYSIISQ